MGKYEITAIYSCTVVVGEVDAESEEEAIEKAYQKNIVDNSIDLCWECARKVDELTLEEASLTATKITE